MGAGALAVHAGDGRSALAAAARDARSRRAAERARRARCARGERRVRLHDARVVPSAAGRRAGRRRGSSSTCSRPPARRPRARSLGHDRLAARVHPGRSAADADPRCRHRARDAQRAGTRHARRTVDDHRHSHRLPDARDGVGARAVGHPRDVGARVRDGEARGRGVSGMDRRAGDPQRAERPRCGSLDFARDDRRSSRASAASQGSAPERLRSTRTRSCRDSSRTSSTRRLRCSI